MCRDWERLRHAIVSRCHVECSPASEHAICGSEEAEGGMLSASHVVKMLPGKCGSVRGMYASLPMQ